MVLQTYVSLILLTQNTQCEQHVTGTLFYYISLLVINCDKYSLFKIIYS